MTNRRAIDRLLNEVIRGWEPHRVVERYLDALNNYTEREHSAIEGLLGLYADLQDEDARVFDRLMHRFHEDDSYPLTAALRDMMAANVSEFMQRRVREIVTTSGLKIDADFDQ